MKRFRFKLETLLEIRKRKEDAVKQELAEQNRKIAKAQAEMAQLTNDLKELQNSEKKTRTTVQNVLTLRYSVAYRNKLKLDMLSKGREIDDHLAVLGTIHKKLTTAMKERRAIEIVREKKMGEWKKEYNSQQQSFIDDVSQQGFIRKKKNAAVS